MVGCLEICLESGCAWLPDIATAVATLKGDGGFGEIFVPYFNTIMKSIFG